MKLLAIVAIACGIFAAVCCIIGMAIPVWTSTEATVSQTIDVKVITYSGLYQVCTRREVDTDINCDDLSDVAGRFTDGLKATLAMVIIGCVFIIASVVVMFLLCICIDDLPLLPKISGGLAFAAALFMLIAVIIYGTDVKSDLDFSASDLNAGFGLVLVGAVACIVAGALAFFMD